MMYFNYGKRKKNKLVDMVFRKWYNVNMKLEWHTKKLKV